MQGAAALHLSNLPQQHSSSFSKCDARAGRGGGASLRTCSGIKPSEVRSVRPERSGTFCGDG